MNYIILAPMIFSVIIVNYRVRYFLELCLHSVHRALAGIEAEIIVVDNDSRDGSIEALRPLFPGVRFVENQENLGFGRANNLGLREAKGRYVLFLNPDTVLPEDFAQVCWGFLEGRLPTASVSAGSEGSAALAGMRGIGAVGVRMIDGGGRFLPESRRGFPTPWVAFCKLAGLSALFPRSRVFAGYYLGGLPEDHTIPAPVLSGACLLVRRAILEEVGGFDERFFMYAEDIDLSYRIEKAGYRNYYLAATTVVHFKGESTQKDIRYIRQFYKAMSQFRRKHFNKGLRAVFNTMMEAAIRVRTGLGGLGRTVKGRRAGDDRTVEACRIDAGWKICLRGDPGEIERLRAMLPGGVVVSDVREANRILFCQGPGFSFRECITALEDGRFGFIGSAPASHGPQRVLFHAAGNSSAVGSADRSGRGETLVF